MSQNSNLNLALTPRQKKGLNKIGDVYCPGDGDFFSFTKSRSAELAPRMLENLPDQDRKDLLLLLTVISFLPNLFVRGLVVILERVTDLPTPVGALLRMMQLGLKGIVMSLYYSGEQSDVTKTALETIGYKVGVYKGDGPSAVPSHKSVQADI